MSALPALDWRSLPYPAGADLIKGTALAQAIVPGTRSRFAVVEVRTREADGFPGVRYSVRDAHTVSDADIRDGKTPREVARFDGVIEAVEWCLMWTAERPA